MTENISQIRAAWQNARINPATNPAAANSHRDLGVVLDYVETLIGEIQTKRDLIDKQDKHIFQLSAEGGNLRKFIIRLKNHAEDQLSVDELVSPRRILREIEELETASTQREKK